MAKSPSDITVDFITKHCFAFVGGGCPYTKLAEEMKGIAVACPEFAQGCPFKECKSIGDMQEKMGQLRGYFQEGAWIEFIKVLHMISKVKNLEFGAETSPLFKGGCPFAKDLAGKAIISPDYTAYPSSLTMQYIVDKCPVFGKGQCPYKGIKGFAGNCPAFKNGCPFKEFKTMGEIVEKLAEMRDAHNPKGRAAFMKMLEEVLKVSKEAEKKVGAWPFPPNTCPVFAHDAWGKRIVPKYN